MSRAMAMIAAVLTLTACDRSADRGGSSKKPPAIVVANSAESAIPPPETGPDARTPLGRLENAIDPKSAAGAQAVVERYCAMLKAGKVAEAHKQLSGEASTDARVVRNWGHFGRFDGCATEAGQPLEGAAGSIYTSVPVEFFFDGGTVKLAGSLTLRRVNDVSGSTAGQRRWHIVKFEMEPVD